MVHVQWTKSPNKKVVSVNFNFAVSSLVEFFTLEAVLIGCPSISVQNYHSALRSGASYMNLR
jgi:hypothetical protein